MVQVGVFPTEEKGHSAQDESGANVVYSITISPSKDEAADQQTRGAKKSCCSKLVTLALILLSLLSLVLTVLLIWNYGQLLKYINDNAPKVDTNSESSTKNNPFTFEDMFDMSRRPKSRSFSWLPGDSVSYRDSNGDIVKYDIETGETSLILDAQTATDIGVGAYTMSPDGRYMLLPYDTIIELQDISGVSRYRVYDLETEELIEFPNSDTPGMRSSYLGTCRWQGTSGRMTFVWEGNLYMVDTPGEEPVALTTNGDRFNIRNGLAFSFTIQGGLSHLFSSNQQYLAYAEYDATSYKKFQFPWYADYNNVYGETYTQTFPKAGDPENFVSTRLMVIDMSSETFESVQISPPEDFASIDHYVLRISWRDSSHLSIVWSSRNQTYVAVEICNINTLACIRNVQEQVEEGWLESSYLRRNLDEGNAYIATVLRDEGAEEGTFMQVAIISADLEAPGEVTYLTQGTKEVSSYVAYDPQLEVVYYYGVDDVEYGQKLFRVGTPTSGDEFRQPECVSCRLIPDCGQVSVSFSSSTKYAVFNCAGPGVPYQVFLEIDGDTRVVLEDNQDTQDWIDDRFMPTREFRLIPVGSGEEAWAEIVFPPNFVEDGSVKYPVLFYPYGGPNFKQANLQFKIDSRPRTSWEIYLASSEDVITVRLDGRGAAGRGARYRHYLYKAMGTVEVQDQISAAQWMKDNYDWVDQDKFAIWGWSYGGFVTSHVIGDETNVIPCGLAVAPVTDFRLYYAGYGERYNSIDTPQDNEAGFNRTDVMRKAENFRGKQYFLAHGTADDNVHFQNAAQLVRALTTAEIDFDFMMYTDDNHYVATWGPKRHMFRKMTTFLLEKCWNMQPNFLFKK